MLIPFNGEDIDPINDASVQSSRYDTDTREITQEFYLLSGEMEDLFLDGTLDEQILRTERLLGHLTDVREKFQDRLNDGITCSVYFDNSSYSGDGEDEDEMDGKKEDPVLFVIRGSRIIRPGDPGHRDVNNAL